MTNKKSNKRGWVWAIALMIGGGIMTLVRDNFEVEYTGLLLFTFGVILLVALMSSKR